MPMTDPICARHPRPLVPLQPGRARAAFDVFQAAPLGLVVASNGSVLAEVRSVGRTGRAWAVIGSLEMRRRNAAPAVVPVGVLGWAGVRTEVVVGSGERKEE
jgi:hypothetical protein